VLATLAIAVFCGVSAPPAQGASITWSAPQDITGDSDVSTNGSLVGAFNLGNGPPSSLSSPGSPTVNGVTFQEFAVPNGTTTSATMGNFTMTSANNFDSRNGNAASADPPFANLSAGYQTLLASFVGQSPWTLTISGLTLGTQYEFQWWINFSSAGANDHTSATARGTVTLGWNPSDTDGGVGQFALGTFTANATTQAITFDSPDFEGIVSGFQLRQTGPAGVPDSGSTFGLLLLAVATLFGASRFRSFRLA
jgi:VPDSG-CTERM motif